MELMTSWERRGREEGLKEGREEGLEEGRAEGRAKGIRESHEKLVRMMLRRRFGALPSRLDTQLKRLSVAELERLAEALLDFESLDDFSGWLRRLKP